MGRSLDANAVYGFSLERCPDFDFETESYPDNFGLPKGFTQGLTNEEIAEVTYMEIEELGLDDIVSAVVELKYPLLGIDYPGDEDGEEMVVYIQRTKVQAYYGSEQLMLEEATKDEQAQIRSLALLLGKTPGWLLYPTYG